VPGRPSIGRLRFDSGEISRDETLELFARMAHGAFAEGSAPVLRARIDMASPNMNLRDPVLYRWKLISCIFFVHMFLFLLPKAV
jgi:glutamyl/glutaminyl-tRNA synthetase